MKKLNELISIGIEVLKQEDKINEKFDGYISSFGASLIYAGLLPTVIFYSRKGGAVEERQHIIEWIEKMLQKQKNNGQFKLKEETISLYNSNKAADIVKLTREVREAAVALKLALRVFI
ncbi:MAG: type III-B CRISPR module-associated protein Cmr5 [Bacteroidales bacterium]